MYIDLFGASDRIGGNIADMAAQVLYAFHNNIYIRYNRTNLRVYYSYNQSYNDSIFMQTIFDIIDNHNNSIYNKDLNDYVELTSPTHFEVSARTLLNIQQDLFSYFNKNLYTNEFRSIFMEYAKNKGYEIPFDPKNTILIHLRLEDVKNRPDYDGSICANYFKDLVEYNIIPTETNVNELISKHPISAMQSPIPFERIQTIIDSILKDKPGYEVIIVTNPGEDLSTLPYKVISNQDECYDLFLLCNSEVVILSRSNFALSSLFFGIANEVYIPLWGVTSCLGLNTKYDQTTFNYFI
jgi:hypothetical protein